MKLKVLALSVVGLFTLAACGGSTNNGNQGGGSSTPESLPSGGEQVDLTDSEKSASLLANIQSGLMGSASAATTKGVSVRLNSTENISVEVGETKVALSNGSLNLALDGKADSTILNSESPVDILESLEGVFEYRMGGKVDVTIPYSVYNDAGEKTGTEKANLSLNMNNLGFKAEVVDSVAYLDLSDRSILNFGVNNYKGVLGFIQKLGGDVPSEDQIKEMLGIEDDLGTWATKLWGELNLDKVQVSADELGELLGIKSDNGIEVLPEGLAKNVLAEDPIAIDILDGDFSAQFAEFAAVFGYTKVIEVKQYEDKLGVQLDLTKEKLINSYKADMYYRENNNSLEGFDLSTYTLPEEDGFIDSLNVVRKLDVKFTVMFDESYRITSINASADLDIDIESSNYDPETGESQKYTAGNVKGNGTVKLSCDYAGPKVTPASSHEGYTNVGSIIDALGKIFGGEQEPIEE